MDKLTTIYIHLKNPAQENLVKEVVNHLVKPISLVAWYPSLGDNGLQAIFVTDACTSDHHHACQEVVEMLCDFGITAQIKIQEVNNNRVTF